MNLENIKNFYDDLAEYYHLIFEDFEKTLNYQGSVLDKLIKLENFDKSSSILDCASGIGTQSLSLSLLGYNVTGSDLSANAVERANIEAKKRGLKVKFFESDFSI